MNTPSLETEQVSAPESIHSWHAWHDAQRQYEHTMFRLVGVAIAIGLIAGGLTSHLGFAVVITILCAAAALVAGPRPPQRPAMPAPLPRAPRSYTGRNLCAIGVLALFIGSVLAWSALNADTTVAVGVSASHRVHNLGLMHAQNLRLILASVIGLGGLVTLLFGLGRKEK